MQNKIVWIVACCALIGTAVAGAAHAQAYPVKAVRMVNPFSPGGSLDLVSRAIARTMTIDLGQSVFVDNRPGAGGNLGVEIVAKAPADGYTLLAMQSSMVINPTCRSRSRTTRSRISSRYRKFRRTCFSSSCIRRRRRARSSN
jgi:tripartite-type tricarboxylate transporter receptor subunit TctC